MQNIDFEIETHPLAPFLPKNGKLLMLGSFPPPKTRWKMDFYYPNYQNDMWRIFGVCFFQDKDYFLDLPNKNFHLDKIIEFLNDKVIGIITDGDIRRMLNERDTFVDLTAIDIMTKNPKMTSSDAMVVEALNIMEDFSITQLVVVDNGEYKGVLHLHDILKEGIV